MIKVLNVSKKFGDKEVLKGVSFEVGSGEILGLVGENGAGKSTLLKILCTLLKPGSGDAIIDGYSVNSRPEKVREKIGTLFGGVSGLYEKMTPRENLSFFGKINGLSGKEIKSRIDFLSNEFSFKDYENVLVEKLSTGMRQKVAIARTIVHSPSCALFDEPEIGLDFEASKTVFDFMENYKKEGKSIIFSSHSLENVKNHSDKIAVLAGGKIVNIFSIEEYRKKYTEKQINDIILNLIFKEEKNG